MSYTEITGASSKPRFPTTHNENLRRARFLNLATKTAAFTAWADDVAGSPKDLYVCTGTYAATLPAANAGDALLGRVIEFANEGAGTITITPDGSDTVGGAATLALAAGARARIVSDAASDWIVL